MGFKQVHSVISFPNLLKLLVGLAIGLQVVVISFNHLSGYYIISDVMHFISKLFIGSTLSLIAAFLVSYPDLFLIQYMNKIAPWRKNLLKRIVIQIVLTLLIATLIAVLITSFSNWIHEYTEDIVWVYVYNILIISVVNIIVVAIFEALVFFIESDRAKQKADHLQNELSQIKFEVLKSQINPHFMFNSLNVLSGLMNKDIKKAQIFIDEFSHIYRYVLETIEQPVATVGKELDFTRSYLFLQQIRYGNDLSYTINIPADLLDLLLPPLSLQVVLENATKHNIVNDAKPLRIEIFNEGLYLVIRNNIQPKISKGVSTGLGLKNLIKRYAMISDKEPLFLVETSHYIAKLPLIEPENDERINY